MKGTLKQYVAGLVDEMTKAPSRLRLGGEDKILTVLFSDLEGSPRTRSATLPTR